VLHTRASFVTEVTIGVMQVSFQQDSYIVMTRVQGERATPASVATECDARVSTKYFVLKVRARQWQLEAPSGRSAYMKTIDS